MRADEETAVTLQHHLEDCYEVRLETNAALEALNKQLEPWNRVAIFLDGLTTFLTKYGLRLLWTIVTGVVAAYAGILVQGYNAQHSAEKAAQAAQTAASTSAAATQKLTTKIDKVISAANSTAQ